MTADQGALVLTNDDIKQIVDLPSYIDALELAFKELSEGIAQNEPRRRIFTPLREVDTHHWFNMIAGVVPAFETAAIRINSGQIRFKTILGTKRMEFPGTLVGLVHLFDIQSGALKATIHDFYINPIRVACTSALGVKFLSRKNSRTMGLLGTGWQARWHISAILGTRPFRRVQIFSPNPEHRNRFVEQQQSRFPEIEFVSTATAEQAVRGTDVLVVATNAITPVLNGDWIAPGTYVVSISGGDRLDQRREFDERTVTRASIVIVNSKEQLDVDKQDELLSVIAKGHLSRDQIKELSDVVIGSIAELPEDAIRFHYNNTGMGIQFAAVGATMLKAAESRGLGTRLAYTWRGRGV